MIDGAAYKELKMIPDERGFLMEILRSDDPLFQRFGQAYVTAAYPAWSRRGTPTKRPTLCVIAGMRRSCSTTRARAADQGEITSSTS